MVIEVVQFVVIGKTDLSELFVMWSPPSSAVMRSSSMIPIPLGVRGRRVILIYLNGADNMINIIIKHLTKVDAVILFPEDRQSWELLERIRQRTKVEKLITISLPGEGRVLGTDLHVEMSSDEVTHDKVHGILFDIVGLLAQ